MHLTPSPPPPGPHTHTQAHTKNTLNVKDAVIGGRVTSTSYKFSSENHLQNCLYYFFYCTVFSLEGSRTSRRCFRFDLLAPNVTGVTVRILTRFYTAF